MFCFSFVINATGLSATYPPPISSIFETTDMNGFPHAYTGENFFQFLHSGFRDRAAAQTARGSWATGIILGASRHPKDVPFVREF